MFQQRDALESRTKWYEISIEGTEGSKNLHESYRNRKIRNARNVYEDYVFTRMLRVWPQCSATEKNTSLRFTVRNKGATGARSTTEKSERSKENLRSFFLFPFSLSLSIFFFEHNSSPCSKILKIVVPADVSQWHQSKLTMKGKGVNLGEAFKTALETKRYLLNSLLGEYPRIGIQIRDVKIV